MLCEDADDAQARLLAAGLAAGVPAPKAICRRRRRRHSANVVEPILALPAAAASAMSGAEGPWDDRRNARANEIAEQTVQPGT